MKELVDGILTMSKLDGGRVELDCREMDLAGFIRDELTSLKGMEVAEQIQFQMQEGLEPVMALADRELLERAFRNVISNCVRYAAGLVEVKAEVRDGWAAVTIGDEDVSKSQVPTVSTLILEIVMICGCFWRWGRTSRGNASAGATGNLC